jgi:hypothetical protein
MDNRINEIRRKISVLRADMALLAATIRDQVNHDLDCSEAAYRLLTMRAEMTVLVGRWKTAGGSDWLPAIRDRLKKGDRLAGRPNRAGRR